MRLTLILLALASAVAAIAFALSRPSGSSQAQNGRGPAGALPGVVAFESDRFGNSDVFLQRGGSTIRVTNQAAQQGQPAFGCDDHTMYIVSNQNGPLRIWRATAGVPWDQYAEGGAVQLDELTSGFVLDNAPYAYCGAQSYVFFSRFPLCGTCNADVWRMDLDGGNAINLTNDPAEDGAPFPFLDAEGSPKLVFASNRDGDSDIYSMDMNGGNVQQLTNNPAFDYYPSVGIDAVGTRHLLFSSDRDGNAEIYTQQFAMGAGAGIVLIDTSLRLTNDPATDIDPAPDTSGLGFSFTHTPSGGTADIWLAEVHIWSPVVDLDTGVFVQYPNYQDSASAWADLLVAPEPTSTPLVDIFTPTPPGATPTPREILVSVHKEDADTGRPLGGWGMDAFRGAGCTGTVWHHAVTDGFGLTVFGVSADQEWSFREVAQPGWEEVAPGPNASPCRTIDVELGDHQNVTFRNRRVGRRGDSNGDGEITPVDATLDLQFSADLIHDLLGPGDANGDGHVNSIDANLKLQHSAGLYEIPVM